MLTPKHIIERLNSLKTYTPIVGSEDLEDSLVSILASIINESDLYFYDLDIKEKNQEVFLESHIDLSERILSSSTRLFFKTSGTTGTPKKITQNVSKLSTGIIKDKQLQELTWGFCYSTRHISGLLLMLQAMSTNSAIVDLRNLNRDDLSEQLISNAVTNISAPSTFYRLNFPLKKQIDCVKKVTNGGEPLDAKTEEVIKASLPQADIRNIYASTEFGSLLVSKGGMFKIPEKLKEKVKIENDLLFVHKSIVSTQEELVGDWYNTKDKIEWVNDTQFIIKGRVTEDVKIMGHLVSLRKVEGIINSLDTIKICKISYKPHKIFGSLLYCEIVPNDKEIDIKILKSQLKKRLRNYEIPSKFIIVKEIEMTSTGKLKR